MTLSKEEKREAGFKEVYAYLHSEEVNKYCMSNRLYIEKYYSDIDTVMYEGTACTLITDKWENFGSREDSEFVRFKLGLKGIELIILNDDGAYKGLIDHFIKREPEYVNGLLNRKRKEKRENGEFCGGRVPYGYYLMNGKLYIDDFEGFVVKFIFYRNEMGCTLRGIARELKLRNIKTRKGTDFTGTMVRNILNRKALYQGYMNGVKGKHRAIIGEEELLSREFIERTFDEEVEKKLMARKRQGKPKNIPYVIKKV